jgi:hypothetical protein
MIVTLATMADRRSSAPAIPKRGQRFVLPFRPASTTGTFSFMQTGRPPALPRKPETGSSSDVSAAKRCVPAGCQRVIAA